MHTLFGVWLDDKGNAGYSYIFVSLIFLSLIGVFTAIVIIRRARRLAGN